VYLAEHFHPWIDNRTHRPGPAVEQRNAVGAERDGVREWIVSTTAFVHAAA